MAEISELDRTILRLMQKNARTRLDDITAQAGASAATVQRRVKHLRSTGIISSEVAIVDPEAVEFAMTFLILVELERESLHQLDSFRRKAKAEHQIQQCYYITGEADFALIALAKNMKDYEALTQRLFFEDTNVKRFRTSVVMDRTKVGMTVPV
ncbi:MAG: Lrp/AsnC family transcriptional regulator [Rhodobacteraceae bacterium]|nr:Lrp/AsnC family transcriptional regulator [Paracoccaceae bacterium]